MYNTLKQKRLIYFTLIGFLILPFFFNTAMAEENVDLPKTMVWSTYDVGSSGYVQASAIANAFSKKYDMRIRLMPSGTGIGRMTPLATDRVDAGFLANETYFAAEGIYDFSVIEWGPQDLRIVAAHPDSVAMPTAKDANIRSLKDLKGKRVTYVPGAPSLNVKMDAILAFANLTWDDVKRVECANYSESFRALVENKADAAVGSVTSPIMYELEESKRGLYWVEFPPENKEAWERLQNKCPFLFPFKETKGAGISKDNPRNVMGFKYPMVTVYADQDADWVYNFIKAIDESYPLYKDAHPAMPLWKIENSVPPADIPFHKGAVKYLKEKGIWTDEHESWNKERIEHMSKLQEAWDEALEKRAEQDIKGKDFSEFWKKERKKALGDL